MVRRDCNTLYNYLRSMANNTPDTSPVDVETQTVIRVFPHILDGDNFVANVVSDKKSQTEVSIKPNLKNDRFYSLLRFIPYRDIQENCIRIIDLPRLTRLQFTPRPEFDKMAEEALQFSLADDDGVGYICSDIIHRLARKRSVFVDADAQTDLKVRPHLLKEDHVAVIFDDSSTQTIPAATSSCARRSATNKNPKS